MLVVDIMPGILELELLEMISVRRMKHAAKKRRPYQNPFHVYTEKQFKQRFRFSKAGVIRLHDKVVDHLQYIERRGRPLDSMQQLLIGLQFLGSTDLLSDTGDCLMVSTYSAWKCVDRVVNAILTLEPEFVYYPDRQQMETTASYIFNKYGIRNIFMGVDGTHIQFPEKPRDILQLSLYKQEALLLN